MWRTCRLAVLVLGPMWSIHRLIQDVPRLSLGTIVRSGLDPGVFIFLVNCLVVVTWLALVIECLRHHRDSRRTGEPTDAARHSTLRHFALWMAGAATLVTGAGDKAPPHHAHATIPIGDAVTPVIAGSILTQVLARRREQIRSRFRPDRLSDTEMEIVGRLVGTVETSSDDSRSTVSAVTVVTADECEKVLSAVERPARPLESPVIPVWDVKVQVFGFPIVTGADGTVAEFRKKKALELLVWLVLNRDRTRRSAARTSLWEFAISDSTFSTVISDMRRALSGLGGAQTHQQWVPPTYSDVIPLAPTIVSDYDLLRQAHERFLENDDFTPDFANAVAGIRDIPFAGTNYLWADMDGTTTRLVIAALDSCRDLAQWALERNRRSELDVAVSAALRVMPGCDEFLEIQNLYLSNSYTYRRAVRR